MFLAVLLPFTYPWIIRHHFSKNKKVLDLGTGDGSFMKKINSDGIFEVVGVELFDPYIKKAKKTCAYKKIIKGDLTRLEKINDKFDVVHSSQVIEHLTKLEGKKLLREVEKLAIKRIVIGTPNGHFHQEGYDENIHQAHKSSWSKSDFERLGYKVYGQGLKLIYGEGGLLEKSFASNIFIKSLLFAISYLFSPVAYYFPKYAAHLIAVKEK